MGFGLFRDGFGLVRWCYALAPRGGQKVGKMKSGRRFSERGFTGV